MKAEITPSASGIYEILYRMGDFSQRRAAGELDLDGDALSLGDLGPWSREWPRPHDPDAVARVFASDELFLRRLSEPTMWLRIPDFGRERAAPLNALLEANADALNTTPNLIIDHRANGGGDDYVCYPLLPLLYTPPIYAIDVEMRATADNIALRQAIADRITDSLEAIAAIEMQNRIMADHLGEYVQVTPRPFSIFRFDGARAFPRRVAVIIDGADSSGEEFILAARQNSKVVLFGRQNSAGILDFANVVSMSSPSGRFGVQWGTSRSLRLPDDPVDPGGIEPEVRIPAGEPDPVNFTRRWLERRRL